MNYLVNADDFVATRIALTRAKLTIVELIAVYKMNRVNINLDSLNEQAEDRAHRIGQKDSVYVQYVVLPESMDELVLNAILKKEESIRKVIG